jgi:Fe-S oxidoreductase
MAEMKNIYDVKFQPAAAENYIMHRAKEKDIKWLKVKIPYPELPPEHRPEVAIRKLDELRKTRKSLQLYLDICVRCGACIKQCHYYLGTGDPKNTPVGRAELLRKVYKRYFTISGRIFGSLVGASDLTNDIIENEWYKYFYQCSECRRCSVFCPYGIDQAEITMAGREILANLGLATKYITEVIAKVYDIGNNLGIPDKAFKSTCEFLIEDVKEMEDIDIEIPVDKEKADILYVPPSADLFTNTDTMIGVAKVMNALGVDWTMSTYASEAANFGLFQSYIDIEWINKRIVDKAKEIDAKLVIIGECGHAWRAARQFMEKMNGPLPFKYCNILEYTADKIRKGKIKLDKSQNDDVIVTLHDPCNMARAGNLISEPRYIIKSCVNDFREMPDNTIKEKTFCCGGGGGLLTEEIMELRMKGGMPRAEAVRSTGANYLAAPCAIDKAQLPLVMSHYKLEVQVGGVHDLVGKAIVMK